MSLRILYLSHLHPPPGAKEENIGGMQRVSEQLSRAFEARADVELLALVNETSWDDVIWSTTRFLTRNLVALPHRARRFRPDVVLFSSMATAALAPLLRPRMQAPLVTITHGLDVTTAARAYQWWVPKVFGALDSVISVSQATREACLARGLDPRKGVVLPNGIDLDEFGALPERMEARERLGGELGLDLEGRRLLLTVGRMVRRKGHAWFIRNVFAQLPERCHYVTVGEGPERGDIDAATRSCPAASRIHHLGRVDEELLRHAYRAADVFVMPNVRVPGDMEGFGVVLLEANLAGAVAAAASMEGPLDVVASGRNGVSLEPESPRAWIDGLTALLDEDLEAFGARARQHVLDTYGWTSVADRYVQHLAEVARGR